MSEKRQARTFLEHIHELRKRLFASGLAFIAGGVLAYLIHVPILDYLHRPFKQTLYYTSPAGAFNLAMKISLLGGIVFVLPVLAYNLISFVQPALTHQFSRRGLRLIMLLTIVLAAGGTAFAYYVVVPMSLSFFSKFNTSGFQSLISATDYMNFVINCVIAFVVIFQIPLLILLVDKIKPLPPKRLIHYERHVIVASLLIALILPFTYDPLTQFLIALPMVVLYNLSIILVLWAHHQRKAEHKRQPLPIRSEKRTPTPVEPAAIPVPFPRQKSALISDFVRAPSPRHAAAMRSHSDGSHTAYTRRPTVRRDITGPKRRYPAQLVSDIIVRPAPQPSSQALETP